ncbi:CRISPR-associated helicase Cas3' [Siccirubricoccus sp. KC 17139]|uniref:CRISPR-associated helicase Cas3 n=1 Tax=Siccirubricoccus soli TaxID=2899147 RepID=A0ABT1D273_9PROT|nr:CRISPR-associated helicase Cas3' [Siccirubricoccus soli]MCO6416032.1 CRISPR-associated helicase Cas3' [Siccirubricoccus soli]MCP2682164.1 CRISPR-associated helicase Cas3' [Siccirubricoccus soli]
MPTSRELWAKILRDKTGQIVRWHHLVAHSADVAAVAEALLDMPILGRRLARLADRDALDPVTKARLAALCFLHDIGKANRGFRRRVDPQALPVGHIDQLLWLVQAPDAEDLTVRLHDVLGLDRLAAWFGDEGSCDLFDAVFAHHGRPWRVKELPILPSARAHWRADAEGDPIADLAPLRQALDAWFAPAFERGPPLPETPPFHHAFAGLLMLADWLGSDERFFPMANGSYAGRMAEARVWALEALTATGLAVEPRRLVLRAAAPDFAASFGVPRPRPAQAATGEAAARCLVLEAETGSGKTEAALWRFKTLFEQGAVDGLYFALPTRVAATQVFHRVLAFRDRLFGPADQPAVVLAVPGQVRADAAEGHPLPDFRFEWSDDPDGGKTRARWAAEHPKRFLAAQIAIGTLDQALLGTIRVKHAHLRGTALLRHLLVVDEVHASDRYMEDLLGSLLREHLRAGGHALLLSATLGAGMRSRLLGTPCPPARVAAALPYPALSWAEAGREQQQALEPAGPGKVTELELADWLDRPEAIAARALRAAEAGARVLVLRNTVGAAVATTRALEVLTGPDHPALFRVGGVPTLHHGRFAGADRLRLDAAVEAGFGRDRGVGKGGVVVGTQTLEVSLDLDADLLLTDLCPADVLLQRLGRLHRHSGRSRPAGFVAPHALVLVPQGREMLRLAERRGRHGLGRVYEDWRMIEATWRLLEGHATWRVPEMNRLLVENATHPEALAAIEAAWREADDRWARHLHSIAGTGIARRQQAGVALLDRSRPFSDFVLASDERLATRLGAKDLLVTVPEGLAGPFGSAPGALRLPHHMLSGLGEMVEPEAWQQTEDGVRFRVGGHAFTYDRMGLQVSAA